MRSDWPSNAPARGWNPGVQRSAQSDSAVHRPSPPATPPPALATPQLLAGVRRSLGLEVAELAMRIAAPPALIAAMEQGRFAGLPPWPETARIVTHWVGLAGIDPRPALSELSEYLAQTSATNYSAASSPGASADDTDARIAAVARVLGNRNRGNAGGWPGTDANAFIEAAPPDASANAGIDAPPSIRHRMARLAQAPAFVLDSVRSLGSRRRAELQSGDDAAPTRIPAWRFGVAGIALLVTLWGAAINTSVVAAAVSVLPAPAGRVIRSFSDFVSEYFAPVREGHRWIDVGDPRTRRADKLRITPRSD